MALDSRIMAMVAVAKNAAVPFRAERFHIETTVPNDLAELGLAKATKKEVQSIIVRTVERDREAACFDEEIDGGKSLVWLD